MNNVTLILLCAGESSRFQCNTKKQWLRIGNEPLWNFVANKYNKFYTFNKTIVVCHKNETQYMQNFNEKYSFIEGGNTRQQSIKNGLQYVTTEYVMVTDIARACIDIVTIHDLLNNKEKADCIVPYLNPTDTVLYNDSTIDRSKVKLIQTPQISNTKKLSKAIQSTIQHTDDSSAIQSIGGSVYYIHGSKQALKITHKEDLVNLTCLEGPSNDFFVGTGIDIHPFENNKQMFLGGVLLEESFGFKAHSDGDVLIHSVIDALLGACSLGDIGEFFPDDDIQYLNIDSKELLQYIVKFIQSVGYEIINIDTTIITQIPKINPHKQLIKKSMCSLLQIPMTRFNIKATTSEKLGFIGREEALAVQSSAMVKYYNWKNDI